MITSEAWRGKRYAVLGLARSGRATVRALVASGAKVIGWDEGDASQEELWGQLKSDRAELGTESGFEFKNWLLAKDLNGYEAVIVSPGVPLNRHPVADKAARYNLPVIGDIELFARARDRLPPHKVVGITGTNGKSTVTALVHHILREAGVPTTMGGNIGLPILAQEPLPEGGVYVLELSSYQIDLTRSLDCDVAVLLNLTPDHLDRYRSMDAYKASKERLFAMQAHGVPRTAIRYPQPYGELDQFPALMGPHNHRNVAAAAGIADALTIDVETIKQAMQSFAGLPHRMERVRTHNGVLFVNDSKATNPDAAAPALATFARVHWIVGGRAKGEDLDACRPHLNRVRAAYAIGEAGPAFGRILGPSVPVRDCGTLEVAVREAVAVAAPGDVVLLSPAAASFDQFTDFEARGDAFRAQVEALT